MAFVAANARASTTRARPSFAHPTSTCETLASKHSKSICRRRFFESATALLAVQCLASERVALAADEIADQTAVSEQYVRTPSGLEYRDIRIGTGRMAQRGDTVRVKWTGRLADRYGWPFQREDADVVSVRLTENEVMQGFLEGVIGMHEGGRRRLLIPKHLGYVREGQQPVPADFGDRRRLYSTVLNKRRFVSAGDLLIDVELKRSRPMVA